MQQCCACYSQGGKHGNRGGDDLNRSAIRIKVCCVYPQQEYKHTTHTCHHQSLCSFKLSISEWGEHDLPKTSFYKWLSYTLLRCSVAKSFHGSTVPLPQTHSLVHKLSSNQHQAHRWGGSVAIAILDCADERNKKSQNRWSDSRTVVYLTN